MTIVARTGSAAKAVAKSDRSGCPRRATHASPGPALFADLVCLDVRVLDHEPSAAFMYDHFANVLLSVERLGGVLGGMDPMVYAVERGSVILKFLVKARPEFAHMPQEELRKRMLERIEAMSDEDFQAYFPGLRMDRMATIRSLQPGRATDPSLIAKAQAESHLKKYRVLMAHAIAFRKYLPVHVCSPDQLCVVSRSAKPAGAPSDAAPSGAMDTAADAPACRAVCDNCSAFMEERIARLGDVAGLNPTQLAYKMAEQHKCELDGKKLECLCDACSGLRRFAVVWDALYPDVQLGRLPTAPPAAPPLLANGDPNVPPPLAPPFRPKVALPERMTGTEVRRVSLDLAKCKPDTFCPLSGCVFAEGADPRVDLPPAWMVLQKLGFCSDCFTLLWTNAEEYAKLAGIHPAWDPERFADWARVKEAKESPRPLAVHRMNQIVARAWSHLLWVAGDKLSLRETPAPFLLPERPFSMPTPAQAIDEPTEKDDEDEEAEEDEMCTAPDRPTSTARARYRSSSNAPTKEFSVETAADVAEQVAKNEVLVHRAKTMPEPLWKHLAEVLQLGDKGANRGVKPPAGVGSVFVEASQKPFLRLFPTHMHPVWTREEYLGLDLLPVAFGVSHDTWDTIQTTLSHGPKPASVLHVALQFDKLVRYTLNRQLRSKGQPPLSGSQIVLLARPDEPRFFLLLRSVHMSTASPSDKEKRNATICDLISTGLVQQLLKQLSPTGPPKVERTSHEDPDRGQWFNEQSLPFCTDLNLRVPHPGTGNPENCLFIHSNKTPKPDLADPVHTDELIATATEPDPPSVADLVVNETAPPPAPAAEPASTQQQKQAKTPHLPSVADVDEAAPPPPPPPPPTAEPMSVQQKERAKALMELEATRKLRNLAAERQENKERSEYKKGMERHAALQTLERAEPVLVGGARSSTDVPRVSVLYENPDPLGLLSLPPPPPPPPPPPAPSAPDDGAKKNPSKEDPSKESAARLAKHLDATYVATLSNGSGSVLETVVVINNEPAPLATDVSKLPVVCIEVSPVFSEQVTSDHIQQPYGPAERYVQLQVLPRDLTKELLVELLAALEWRHGRHAHSITDKLGRFIREVPAAIFANVFAYDSFREWWNGEGLDAHYSTFAGPTESVPAVDHVRGAFIREINLVFGILRDGYQLAQPNSAFALSITTNLRPSPYDLDAEAEQRRAPEPAKK
jgi:hypothetical protein